MVNSYGHVGMISQSNPTIPPKRLINFYYTFSLETNEISLRLSYFERGFFGIIQMATSRHSEREKKKR